MKYDMRGPACIACGRFGQHGDQECRWFRPRCHVPLCKVVTCSQAMAAGARPTCLGHWFGEAPVAVVQ